MHQKVLEPAPAPMVDIPPEDPFSRGWVWSVGDNADDGVGVSAAAAGETRRAEETSTAAAEAKRVRFIASLSPSDEAFSTFRGLLQRIPRLEHGVAPQQGSMPV